MDKLNPIESAIPAELKPLPIWVAWRYETRDGKPTKVPLNPRTLGRAMSNNPATWGTYEQAVKQFLECENESIAGIGFMLSNGYAGTDLDHCYNSETGEILPWAREVIDGLNSWTFITPSGEGIRTVVKGALPEGRRVVKGLPSIDGGNRGEIALYDSVRFLTVTENHLPGTPSTIENRQEELRLFHTKVFGAVVDNVRSCAQIPCPVSLDDGAIIERAGRARNGDKFKRLFFGGDWTDFPSQSEGDLALCSHLAYWTGRDAARIDSLFRRSALMRKKWNRADYAADTIRKAVEGTRDVYKPHCENLPLKKDAAPPATEKQESYEVGINMTDLGNARRFVAAHGADLRYCYPWGKWLFWNGQRWAPDDQGEVARRAKATVTIMYKQAFEEQDPLLRKALAGHALRCESDGKLKAMVELAKSEPGIPILPDDLDRDPWALNVLNGTIDLRTGFLRPHDRQELLTKLAPVEFKEDAECPFWIAHMNRIMDRNPDLIGFIQRGMGYSLTGITDERVLMILHGPGGNGKSLTDETSASVMGDYAVRTPTETLLVKREGGIPNDVARLRGARFVFCSEADEGKRFGESLVKDLTGGDTISARFMRAEWFDFKPTFKIWLATNHKPIIRGTDNAIWDRIRLIPFNVTIPENERIPKREMTARFQEELPGILGWMVNGCLDWQSSGLGTPDEVRQATAEYRTAMDTLADFIEDCCEVSRDATDAAKNLFSSYLTWAERSGEKPISQKAFGSRLIERGFQRLRGTAGVHSWVGIQVKQ